MWYLRLGWGICSSLWSLSSRQALFLNTALLLSALTRILAFVPNNLRGSGKRNDSCVVLFARWHALLIAEPSPDTQRLSLFWWMEPFSGNPTSRWLCEWITLAHRLVEMNATVVIHTHTHTNTQVAAVSTGICCKVFHTCTGGLQSRPLCSEVFTCSDKCLPCWLTSSRLLFLPQDLGGYRRHAGSLACFRWYHTFQLVLWV